MLEYEKEKQITKPEFCSGFYIYLIHAGKTVKIFAHQEDYELITELLNSYYKDELTLGQMLRIMRKDLLEMTQADYAKLVGISRRSLSDLEQDQSHPTAHNLNAVFAPFGLKTGLIPANQLLEVYASIKKSKH